MRGVSRRLQAGRYMLIDAKIPSEEMFTQGKAAERGQQSGQAACHTKPRRPRFARVQNPQCDARAEQRAGRIDLHERQARQQARELRTSNIQPHSTATPTPVTSTHPIRIRRPSRN